MTFDDILKRFREESFSEREKGAKFEKLIKRWFLTDPMYANTLETVWLWEEFPSKYDLGGSDLGIDLVAKTYEGDFWAIQCKCYDESTIINKPIVDSFLSNANRTFNDPLTLESKSFSQMVWVSTTSKWNINAEKAIQNQRVPFIRIHKDDLRNSAVDWERLFLGKKQGKEARLASKTPLDHQNEAIEAAHKYFKDHDRGKLIMACGTGKTYTSLKIIEKETGGKGLILYMVPSIALLAQGLNNWTADTTAKIYPICICSDAKASKINEDDDQTSLEDIPFPASTSIETITRHLRQFRKKDGLIIVFSTYQSIDVISEAQKAILEETDGEFGKFDFVVCDEAHRTTGSMSKNKDRSNFTKIHDNEIISAKKRLYMTATPRYYQENLKNTAKEKDIILWSMDDTAVFGEEFYRIGFGRAVSLNLLTDYKVLVLTLSEDKISDELKKQLTGENKELTLDDYSKLIGCANALSKRVQGDHGATYQQDPVKMHRAVAFCSTINRTMSSSSISSKEFAAEFPALVRQYKEMDVDEEHRGDVVTVEARHVDGSMGADERADALQWLKEDTGDPNLCRVLSNVRCLSEGVDVPALDAVIFTSPRKSQVDVVQSVGRVMRSFHKGQADEKKYGYIIVPVVIPPDEDANLVLDNNERFKVVWEILNALRAHDERFNATINKINLNKKKPETISIVDGMPASSWEMEDWDSVNHDDDGQPSMDEINQQLEIRFGELQQGIYAKLVEKVGDRFYWENWAAKVGDIAKKFIARIRHMVDNGDDNNEFARFLKSLQNNINPSIDAEQAIEMLAQHMITRPVFDALFQDYEFVKNNAVSRSMQIMLDVLEKEVDDTDTQELVNFYEDVKQYVGNIDNLEGKQTIIKTLYEKFFKGAFPITVEKLGIVYTPIECVDFIIHSVDALLKKEFNCALTDKNVHILDPFVGTGTFVTRLLQSGLIRKEDMMRKYCEEIFCNEIVLLAYYIADVNIESVFHELVKPEEYIPYDGICLTDTFQISERDGDVLDESWFPENAKGVDRLRETPIKVIMGNPPYSAGQKSANDNAQNLKYDKLDSRISETYVSANEKKGKTVQSLYDSYFRAFRWASDKVSENKEGGIVAFISNGAWLYTNAGEGFRKCLEKEFSSIYVLNLRGNQRTSGELSQKEGGKIFGSGSRATIAMTFLIKKPGQIKGNKAVIHYHDIGDYLTREQKLKMVQNFKSVDSNELEWEILTPNEHGDWISVRNEGFTDFVLTGSKDKNEKHLVFNIYSNGDITHRDPWCYNYSKKRLSANIKKTVDFYNTQLEKCRGAKDLNDVMSVVEKDETSIKWDKKAFEHAFKGITHEFVPNHIRVALYRPFQKEYLYYDNFLNWSQYQLPKIYPESDTDNLYISVSGVGVTKDFSCLISDITPDLEQVGKSICFPLYWYSKNEIIEPSLFDLPTNNNFIRHDGVSDWILAETRNRLKSKKISKEMIFYYVYGFLHCPAYRETFSQDLKISLPRIPIIDDVDAWMDFYYAGKELAKLHLKYEDVPPFKGVTIEDTYVGEDEYAHYAVKKMRHPQKGENGVIIYNDYITIRNIPQDAYNYVVNGKSAIEWIIERYAVTVDKDSLIKNDPNDWGKEQGKPRYIFDLLLSIINLSLKTNEIVAKLPKLRFEGSEVKVDTKGAFARQNSSEDTEKLKEETITLSIKEGWFAQILQGKKKVEERELKVYNAKKILLAGSDGNPVCNPKTTIAGKAYQLDDFNGGKFPFLPKNITRIKFVCGERTALVEVNKITFAVLDRRGDKSLWMAEFHLGNILKRN